MVYSFLSNHQQVIYIFVISIFIIFNSINHNSCLSYVNMLLTIINVKDLLSFNLLIFILLLINTYGKKLMLGFLLLEGVRRIIR
jgi:hypothetical protein